MRAVIYPYFSNSYDVLKALFMNGLILRRQSAASLRSVFFSAEVVVPDEAVKDELNRSLADAQGIASGIRFVTTQAWLDRMNHGSPDVSGRASGEFTPSSPIRRSLHGLNARALKNTLRTTPLRLYGRW